MPFTLEQRHELLMRLNFSQLESSAWQQETDHLFYAQLGPIAQARIPVFSERDIFDRLDAIEHRSQFLVNQVLTILQELEAVDREIASEQSQRAIVQADVVVFDPSLRAIGSEERQRTLINRLRYCLDLPIVPLYLNQGTLGRS